MFECSDRIGRHALWLVVGLVACPAVLPGAGHWPTKPLALTARFDRRSLTGIPVLEGWSSCLHPSGVRPGVGGARPVDPVMVCGADGRGCSVGRPGAGRAEPHSHPYAGLGGPWKGGDHRVSPRRHQFLLCRNPGHTTITIPTYAQYTVSVDNIRVNHTPGENHRYRLAEPMGNVYGPYFHPGGQLPPRRQSHRVLGHEAIGGLSGRNPHGGEPPSSSSAPFRVPPEPDEHAACSPSGMELRIRTGIELW